LSEAAELQKSFEREKNAINGCLSDVSSAIGKHTQWSDILVTMVKNMPDSMVLTNLEAKERSVKRKVPQKGDPGKMVSISVPVRTLQMSISGSSRYDCDKAVRDFRDRLRFSTLLGPKLEDIRVSQKSDTLDGRDVISYEIDCIFKPQL
jgi:Tfp pilus assembly protein PilN